MKIISSSANCTARPALACARILSIEGLNAWWIGKIKILESDPNWPAFGTRMTWRAGGGLFKAQITADERPFSVEMTVVTPSADSIIRHIFEELPDGGTRYTKSVEPIWRTGTMRIIAPLWLMILRKMVDKEVEKAALYADGI